jgi:hypothetical protein
VQRVDDALPLPGQLSGTHLRDAAVSYARWRHWEVLPGTWLETDAGGAPRCSCASAACPSPGAHPARADWAVRASGSAAEVRRMWDRQPRASVLLAAGRGFDVLEVPESAGCHALARTERMDVELGPVIAAPTGRMAFFVLPGARAKAPGLLAALGWPPGALDLTVRGEGDWVAAPPTRMGRGGRAQWVRRPTAENRWLPDVGALLSPLAYACGREAAEGRAAR